MVFLIFHQIVTKLEQINEQMTEKEKMRHRFIKVTISALMYFCLKQNFIFIGAT